MADLTEEQIARMEPFAMDLEDMSYWGAPPLDPLPTKAELREGYRRGVVYDGKRWTIVDGPRHMAFLVETSIAYQGLGMQGGCW